MKRNDRSKEDSQIVIPYGYMPYCPPDEDEIDLRELWATLKRRKKTVWSTTLVVVMLAGIYLLFAKPVYEAKATIAIGKQLVQTKEKGWIAKFFDNADELKKKLDVQYDTAGKYREKNITTYVSAVEIPKKVEGFLTISAVGRNNDEATKTLKKPLDDVLSYHKSIYQSILDTKKNKIENLTEQLHFYETIELQRLKKDLALVKSIDLTRLKKDLELVKNVDLKKVEDQISFIKDNTIPSYQKKILEIRDEIEKKRQSVANLQNKLKSAIKNDASLAAMMSMQIASLQNDVARLNLRIIDLQSKIDEIRTITIPNLENKKTRILEEVIPAKKAAIKNLMEKTIPAKEAAIRKLETITIPQLKAKIDELKIAMRPPYLVPTKIVGNIYTHDKPVKPKKALILAVALITGLMLGIFLAFFKEFIAKEQEK